MADYAVCNTVVVHKDDSAYTSHPSIALLNDGRWIAAFAHSPRRRLTNRHPPGDPLFRTLLSRTSDRGETWEEPYFARTSIGPESRRRA